MGAVDLCEDEPFYFQLDSCCNRNIIVTADLAPKPNAFSTFFC